MQGQAIAVLWVWSGVSEIVAAVPQSDNNFRNQIVGSDVTVYLSTVAPLRLY